MKMLLDQGLPRSCVELLRRAGIDAVHTGECGLATASDAEILDFARSENRVVVTLDADFHALLQVSNAAGPSVIRVRIEGLRAQALAGVLCKVIEQCPNDLATGAMVSVQADRVRVHRLRR